MKGILVYAAAVLLVMLSSCTVMEDRTDCPCFMTIRADTDTDCMVSFYSGDTLVRRCIIDAQSLVSGDNYIGVDKQDSLRVSIVQVYDGMIYDDTSVRCPAGEESSPLHGSTAVVNNVTEETTLDMPMHKHYADVRISVIWRDTLSAYPYSFRMSAGCDGLTLHRLCSTEGRFIFAPSFDTGYNCLIRLPRQNSSEDIRLSVLDGEDVFGAIDLQDIFEAVGYRWDAEDLSDIDIIIDFSYSTLTFCVDDWEVETVLRYSI